MTTNENAPSVSEGAPRTNAKPTSANPLDTALHWAAQGFSVFPIWISRDVDKDGLNKKPATSRGHKNASSDADEIRSMFEGLASSESRALGTGLVAGPSALVVFDLDRKDGKDGIAVAERLGLPETMTVVTASGGEHRYFTKVDSSVRISNASPWDSEGIDIRSDGGWLVAPGTKTPWGEWTLINTLEPAVLPQRLWEQLGTQRTSEGGWRRYQADEHDALLHPATVHSHALLVEHFEVDPRLTVFRSESGREPWLHITRPGKRGGVSASIGFVGPGVVKSFSSNFLDPDTLYGPDRLARMVDELDDESWSAGKARELKIAEEAERIRIRREAKSLVDTESTEPLELPDMKSAAQRKAEGVPKPEWRVDQLMTTESKVAIVAQPKVGKTTATLSLVRCLLEGGRFLERYEVKPIDGSVVIMNYEVSEGQYLEWLDQAGVPLDRVFAWPLRGSRSPLATEQGRDHLVRALQEVEAAVVVVDPLTNALGGNVDPNDNGAVQQFLSAITEVTHRAGVGETVIVMHAGWSADDRARGASVLAGDPDAIWTLTKEDSGDRYFKAYGRDVDVPETRLVYDAATRGLSLDGESLGRKADKRARTVERNQSQRRNKVLEYVRASGPVSIAQVKKECGMDRDRAADTLEQLSSEGVLIEESGPRGARLFQISEDRSEDRSNNLDEIDLTCLTPLEGGKTRQVAGGRPVLPVLDENDSQDRSKQDRSEPTEEDVQAGHARLNEAGEIEWL